MVNFIVVKMENVEAEKNNLEEAKKICDSLERINHYNYMVAKEVKR